MERKEVAMERLLSLAREIDFPRKYYAIVDATRSGEPNFGFSTTEIARTLEATGIKFRYDRRESFYAMSQAVEVGQLGLIVCIRRGTDVLILEVSVPAQQVG